MAKYIVKKKFKDLEKQEIYEVGQEIDITVKRAEEIESKLKGYLERVVEAKPKQKKGD